MKRILRAVTAVAAFLLLGWYALPQVYTALHLPDRVFSEPAVSAPMLSMRQSDAAPVRGSDDERLHRAASGSASVSLFGVLPLKTVSVSAHTKTVMLGGEAVGVVLKTEGVQIVGFERVETAWGSVSPAVSAGLREGDMICALNGQAVSDSDSFAALCAKSDGTCVLSCLRDGEPFTASVDLAIDRNGEKRIGAWVRDSTSGIGTLSFYDPSSRVYAALGHGVTDVDTQKLIAPAKGFLTEAEILRIRKGDHETAGELVGHFSVNAKDAVATVDRNTELGISGTLGAFSDGQGRTVEIAPGDAAHRGEAYIVSTVDGETRAYAVQVIRVDVQSSPQTQGMMIEITDPALLEKTGGIVQGMSGSPLLQDGRLIGVVTHVFLSHPTRGYCLYAEWMADALL